MFSRERDSDSPIRHQGPYALIDGRWLPTRNQPTTAKITMIKLSGVTSDDPVRAVPLSEVARMVEVRPRCLYRGVQFEMTRILDEQSRLVWRDVTSDEPGLRALLMYWEGPDFDRVSKWKGFEYHDPRGGMGNIDGSVPLSEIEDYEEDVTEIPIPGREVST